MPPRGPLSDQPCGSGRGAARIVADKMARVVRMFAFMILVRWEYVLKVLAKKRSFQRLKVVVTRRLLTDSAAW
jgi:hypothetical protein